VAGVEPSILLHPLDLIGPDVAPELRFFPGMDVGGDAKRRFFRQALGMLCERFDVVPMSVHAERIHASGKLPRRATPARAEPLPAGGD